MDKDVDVDKAAKRTKGTDGDWKDMGANDKGKMNVGDVDYADDAEGIDRENVQPGRHGYYLLALTIAKERGRWREIEKETEEAKEKKKQKEKEWEKSKTLDEGLYLFVDDDLGCDDDVCWTMGIDDLKGTSFGRYNQRWQNDYRYNTGETENRKGDYAFDSLDVTPQLLHQVENQARLLFH